MNRDAIARLRALAATLLLGLVLAACITPTDPRLEDGDDGTIDTHIAYARLV